MFNFLFKLICLFVLVVTVVIGFLVALAVPSDAVSRQCRQNSHTITNTLVAHYDDLWKAKSRRYTTTGWVTYCGQAAGARVWKVGVSARFPSEGRPCSNYNSGIRNTVTLRPGGARVSVTKNCENDGYFRKVVRTNIFVNELIAPPQPHLKRLLTIDSTVRAMWGRGGDDDDLRDVVTVRY